MHSRMLVATALLLLPLTGCGSDDPTASPTSTTSPTTTSTTTTTTTTATTTTTTQPAPTTATDGRNLQACADGVCQVLVHPGDELIAHGETLAILSMTKAGVTIQYGGIVGELSGEFSLNGLVTVAITPLDKTAAILTLS